MYEGDVSMGKFVRVKFPRVKLSCLGPNTIRRTKSGQIQDVRA